MLSVGVVFFFAVGWLAAVEYIRGTDKIIGDIAVFPQVMGGPSRRIEHWNVSCRLEKWFVNCG